MSLKPTNDVISSPADEEPDVGQSAPSPEVLQLRKMLTSLPGKLPFQQQAAGAVEQLSEQWSHISLAQTADSGLMGGSIKPLDLVDVVTDEEQPPEMKLLPSIGIEGTGTAIPELALGAPIGRGGMGMVRHAIQLPLKRAVAVKQIHEQLRSPKTTHAMLQEAWITGMLEHPNIVPIHNLGRDADGAPMLVMKEIEGVRWSDLMFAPKHPLRKRDSHDHIEWNFGILMQLCNAVHFAHSKGILHRDLKPDNVMIGAYGEVYLLDWGLSVALPAAQDSGHLPLASSIKSIAGTPSYMAPEMAVAAANLIDERTDVYLLGAILHEILVGKPRHLGRSSIEILMSALYSTPFDYNEKVPKELAAICHKAMHVDSLERYDGAEDFRMALELFLQRRHAIRLSTKALSRLDELKQETVTVDASEELTVHGLFRECRFGFRESLRVWEGNEAAIEGLQDAIETMISYELARGDARAARALFGELLRPHPGLQAQLDALQRQLDAQEKRVVALEQFSHDLDIEVGKGARSWAFLLVGIISGLLSGWLLFAERMGYLTFNYQMSFGSAIFMAIAVIVLSFTARKGFFQNRASRRVWITSWVLVGAMLVHPLGCLLMKTPPHDSLIQLMLIFSACIAVMAANQDLRLFAASGVYLVAYLVASAMPGRILEIMTAANFLGPTMIALVWRPGATPHPISINAKTGQGG